MGKLCDLSNHTCNPISGLRKEQPSASVERSPVPSMLVSSSRNRSQVTSRNHPRQHEPQVGDLEEIDLADALSSSPAPAQGFQDSSDHGSLRKGKQPLSYRLLYPFLVLLVIFLMSLSVTTLLLVQAVNGQRPLLAYILPLALEVFFMVVISIFTRAIWLGRRKRERRNAKGKFREAADVGSVVERAPTRLRGEAGSTRADGSGKGAIAAPERGRTDTRKKPEYFRKLEASSTVSHEPHTRAGKGEGYVERAIREAKERQPAAMTTIVDRPFVPTSGKKMIIPINNIDLQRPLPPLPLEPQASTLALETISLGDMASGQFRSPPKSGDVIKVPGPWSESEGRTHKRTGSEGQEILLPSVYRPNGPTAKDVQRYTYERSVSDPLAVPRENSNRNSASYFGQRLKADNSSTLGNQQSWFNPMSSTSFLTHDGKVDEKREHTRNRDQRDQDNNDQAVNTSPSSSTTSHSSGFEVQATYGGQGLQSHHSNVNSDRRNKPSPYVTSFSPSQQEATREGRVHRVMPGTNTSAVAHVKNPAELGTMEKGGYEERYEDAGPEKIVREQTTDISEGRRRCIETEIARRWLDSERLVCPDDSRTERISGMRDGFLSWIADKEADRRRRGAQQSSVTSLPVVRREADVEWARTDEADGEWV